MRAVRKRVRREKVKRGDVMQEQEILHQLHCGNKKKKKKEVMFKFIYMQETLEE